jgi:hypothetical protein
MLFDGSYGKSRIKVFSTGDDPFFFGLEPCTVRFIGSLVFDRRSREVEKQRSREGPASQL